MPLFEIYEGKSEQSTHLSQTSPLGPLQMHRTTTDIILDRNAIQHIWGGCAGMEDSVSQQRLIWRGQLIFHAIIVLSQRINDFNDCRGLDMVATSQSRSQTSRTAPAGLQKQHWSILSSDRQGSVSWLQGDVRSCISAKRNVVAIRTGCYQP